MFIGIRGKRNNVNEMLRITEFACPVMSNIFLDRLKAKWSRSAIHFLL